MATQAISSIGVKLYYKLGEAEFIEVKDIQEIPELGGEDEAIEVTTLADTAHVYIGGLKNYGDSLAFKAIYVKEQFAELEAMKDMATWKVELPDGANCTFDGTASVKMDAITVNNALTFTLAVKPASEMVWA